MIELLTSLIILLSPVGVEVDASRGVSFQWQALSTADPHLEIRVKGKDYHFAYDFFDVCVPQHGIEGWFCQVRIATPPRYQTGKTYRVWWSVNGEQSHFWANTGGIDGD